MLFIIKINKNINKKLNRKINKKKSIRKSKRKPSKTIGEAHFFHGEAAFPSLSTLSFSKPFFCYKLSQAFLKLCAL